MLTRDIMFCKNSHLMWFLSRTCCTPCDERCLTIHHTAKMSQCDFHVFIPINRELKGHKFRVEEDIGHRGAVVPQVAKGVLYGEDP